MKRHKSDREIFGLISIFTATGMWFGTQGATPSEAEVIAYILFGLGLFALFFAKPVLNTLGKFFEEVAKEFQNV